LRQRGGGHGEEQDDYDSPCHQRLLLQTERLIVSIDDN
jgi:hypothetical protein